MVCGQVYHLEQVVHMAQVIHMDQVFTSNTSPVASSVVFNAGVGLMSAEPSNPTHVSLLPIPQWDQCPARHYVTGCQPCFSYEINVRLSVT
jgi:hypothetical protein